MTPQSSVSAWHSPAGCSSSMGSCQGHACLVQVEAAGTRRQTRMSLKVYFDIMRALSINVYIPSEPQLSSAELTVMMPSHHTHALCQHPKQHPKPQSRHDALQLPFALLHSPSRLEAIRRRRFSHSPSPTFSRAHRIPMVSAPSPGVISSDLV